MLDHRLQTASSHYEGIPWDRTSNDLGWRAALGDRDNPETRAAALIAAIAQDLSGLPPTFLDVGTAGAFSRRGARLCDPAARRRGADRTMSGSAALTDSIGTPTVPKWPSPPAKLRQVS